MLCHKTAAVCPLRPSTYWSVSQRGEVYDGLLRGLSPPTVNLLSSNPAFDKLASALVLFPDARRDKKTKDHNENETVNVLRKYG